MSNPNIFPLPTIESAGVPGNGTSEVQTVTITAFGACVLGLNFKGARAYVTFTGAEDNTAIGVAVLAALVALWTIGASNVTVASTGTTDRAIAITFAAALGKLNVDAIIATLTGGSPVSATLTTALTGSNNDLKFTAVTGGTGGNAITVTYVDPAANSHALVISVLGSAITSTLATDSGGTITSTGATVKAALIAAAPAAALIGVALAAGNDGTGLVTAMNATALTGGLAAPAAANVTTTPGVTATGRGQGGPGQQCIDITNKIPYINQGTSIAPTWVKVSAT